VQEGWLALDRIHTVTLDDVDMAHHTLTVIRAARGRAEARAIAAAREEISA
jgi:hypothetical protein